MVSTDGSARTRSQSTRPISRPVASPACSTRRTLCRRFAAERGPAVGGEVEPRAPRDQLAHVARPVLHEDADRRFVAQPVAGAHRVLGVQRRAVVVADRRGDAALRVAGVAFGRLGLGEDEHAADRRQADGGAQAGDPPPTITNAGSLVALKRVLS